MVALLLLLGCGDTVAHDCPDGEPGSPGEPGVTGAAGANGPPGDSGEQGPPGDSAELEVYSATAEAVSQAGDTVIGALATCDDGDMVLSGGCAFEGQNALCAWSSTPVVGSDAGPPGWWCSTCVEVPSTVHATVLCLVAP